MDLTTVAQFRGRMKLPAIAAPMFLVSGPDLVVEACKAGVMGSFPALNRRSTAEFEGWVAEISERLTEHESQSGSLAAPYGVNLSVRKTNARLEADLDVAAKFRIPLIITSLGTAKEVVSAVHGYGGLVFHDVINARHAEKAVEVGVDGLVAVCAGAGGHAGALSPFALVAEIRRFFGGILVLGGAIGNGRQIAAARMMGADLAYLGTRFIATKESLASLDYKKMLCQVSAKDIVYTPAISGVNASFIAQSMVAAGFDPKIVDFASTTPEERKALAWKTIWSAGQGVGSINDIPSVSELCARLKSEYHEALREAKTSF